MATSPSDPAVALACLDATIITEHAGGGRRLPVTTFHTLPGDDPAAHTVLRPGELITAQEPRASASCQPPGSPRRSPTRYSTPPASASASSPITPGKLLDTAL